ncbi:hypothetical protein ACH5RR_039105 [Cinchona calisaya]|uniref:Reverse transcriptase domain-containing protein n=1 Tax=Cinchona calisaya TaxID=153742 RepID=A0ABD2Y2H1_9GENT
MNKIISPFQNVFVPGGIITDDNIIAHEILHSMKKAEGKHGTVALKLHYSKAYDMLEWPFLKEVFRQINFLDVWIERIMACITSVYYHVLFNGTVTESFTSSRGIHQAYKRIL